MTVKKNICIIPALEKNNYSSYGDLVNWGDSTLLEWKISQAKEAKIFDAIYVSSPSLQIIKIAKKNNVSILKRRDGKNLDQLYIGAATKFKNSNIIFLSTTFPFISPNLIRKFVINYNKRKVDSSFTYVKDYEYFAYRNKFLNFDIKKKLMSRRKINPLNRILPAAIICDAGKLIIRKNIFSKNNNLFKIDWLASLEINTSTDLDVFSLLIKEYFKKKF